MGKINRNIIMFILYLMFVVMVSFVIQSKQIKTTVNEYEEPYIETEESILTKIKPTYKISLCQEHQDLIYNLCEINSLSYELVLAIMYQESKFNSKSFNINKNGSKDISLYQLNDRFLNTHREYAINYCQLSEDVIFDAYNLDHNIRAGIGNIAYLRDYYREKGVIDEEMIVYISNSFNMGVAGFEKYVRQTGKTSRSYSNKILEYKKELEITNALGKI